MMSGGTDGSVDWARMFMTAYDDDIIWGVALPAADTAYMCGEGWTNLGSWQDVAVLAAEAPGTSEAIAGVLGAPAGTETDPGGVLLAATGLEDAPAGETNTTAYRLGLE
jgi:hypothetical protein